MDLSKIKSVQSHSFPISFNLGVTNWITTRSIIPKNTDFIVVKTIAYVDSTTSGSSSNVQLFVINASINGTVNNYIGCFGNISGSVPAANTSSGGSIYNPMTLIKIYNNQQINTIQFQILTPTAFATDALTTTLNPMPLGELNIILEFIELEK